MSKQDDTQSKPKLTRRQFSKATIGAVLALPALAACDPQQETPTALPDEAAPTDVPPTEVAIPVATDAPQDMDLPSHQPAVIRSGADGVLNAAFTMKLISQNVPDNDTPLELRSIVADGIEPVDGKYYPAPTLRMKLGDTVELHLQNDLEPNPNPGECIYDIEGESPPNCFHDFNTTNLHYHGSHVTPNAPGDDVFLALEPGDDFDYCFLIPPAQSPGTHWYHPHKHGSTALHVLNGMAGAFIVEGDFDTVPEIADAQDFVFVLQQIRDILSFPPGSGNPGPPSILINGLSEPTVTMRPGEIQRWRFVSASMQASAVVELEFQNLEGEESPLPGMHLIALDGVQFANDQWGDPDKGETALERFVLAPGGRADFLVKAPDIPGKFRLAPRDKPAPRPRREPPPPPPGQAPAPPPTPTLAAGESPALIVLEVADAPLDMPLPAKGSFPPLPEHLHSITDQEITDASGTRRQRCLVFSKDSAGPGGTPPPKFYIDTKQFDSSRMDHCMVLGMAEEWTIYNTSTIVHPFHIHINPFIVTNIHDPAMILHSEVDSEPMVWQDTILLPPAASLDDGSPDPDRPGYVIIRHRYIDFTGDFVIHCHILGHEDRGMMQKVGVRETETMCPEDSRWQQKFTVTAVPDVGVPKDLSALNGTQPPDRT